MKKNIKLLLCAVGILALLQATLTQGHTEGEEAAAPVAADVAEELLELSGTITSIEAETSTIVVEYAAEDAATSSTSPFKVTEATAITQAEAPIELSDLQAGAQVNLFYSLDEEGMKVVEALIVQ